MKKLSIVLVIVGLAAITPTVSLRAQIPIIDIIKAAVKKVIKAADLQIQRQQNKVIWLQNAQKTLENTLSKTKLDDISNWMKKQETLYKDYYEELKKVKSFISYYKRVKEISEMQVRLVEEYKRAYGLFKQDKHFSGDELSYMARVYEGIITESIQNLDQVSLVLQSFTTEMSDASRLEIIRAAADRIETGYHDLKTFNHQAVLLSLQRARAQQDAEAVKRLYGL